MRKGSIRISKDTPSEVKILPCKIEFSGEVNADGFVPEGTSGSLYGRSLLGQTVELPEEFQGYVAAQSTDLITSSKFNEIKYWNWDKPPTDLDQIPQLMNHLKIMTKLYKS
jgi:hypothetical protein